MIYIELHIPLPPDSLQMKEKFSFLKVEFYIVINEGNNNVKTKSNLKELWHRIHISS